MATYDLDQTQLDAALSANFDAQTRADIIDCLNHAGVFNPTATVDNSLFPSNSNADIFSVLSPFATINTDDPPSAIIANTSQDTTLNIIGHHDVLVATGGGNDQIFLNDRGNDVVFSGAGNDVVIGGAGRDSIHAGAGNDTLDGGTGNDVLDGGAGNDR